MNVMVRESQKNAEIADRADGMPRMMNDKRMFKELRRLLHLPFPPSTEAAQQGQLEEYGRILRDRVESEEHLIAIVDHLMNTCKRCPPPAEVLEAAMEIRPPAKTEAPLGCEKCQGSGYLYVTKHIEIPGMLGYDTGGVKPCDCALGQFIQPEYDKRRYKVPGAAQDLG